VHSPTAGIYGEKKVQFNITALGYVEKMEYIDWSSDRLIWMRLCTWCTGYGNIQKSMKAFKDGAHNITIKATDYFGQVKDENIVFSVDSIKPKISKTLPVRNKVTNGSGFYIRYTENNLKEVSISLNAAEGVPKTVLENCNEPGKNKECTVDLDLSDYDGQEVEYYFSVSDYVRSVDSKPTIIKVDTTSPVLTVTKPEEGITYGKKVPFNISVTEKVAALQYYDFNEVSPRWRNLCKGCNEYGVSTQRLRAFSEGTHNLLIKATDYAGNTDEETVQFTTDY
jgi:hypothetical protein